MSGNSTTALALDGPDVFAQLRSHAVADRTDSIPLWAQVRVVLADAIRSGLLASDAQIPSEQSLAGMFSVSRPVIREALAALVKEGLVVKVPRRGVFVAPPRDELDFAGSNVGLFGDLAAKGHVVTTRTLELERCAPTTRQQALLCLPGGMSIVSVRRVYLIDGVPISVGTVAIPADRAPGLEWLKFENRSLYATLRQHFGIVVSRAERWLDAIPVSEEDGLHLELAAGTPVTRIESIGWSADGTPIEYYDAVYCTHLSRLHFRTLAVPESLSTNGGQP